MLVCTDLCCHGNERNTFVTMTTRSNATLYSDSNVCVLLFTVMVNFQNMIGSNQSLLRAWKTRLAR